MNALNPCFFGPPDRQLFGAYHAPQAGDRRTVVVLCYPGPEEWMRAHWAFRQLAGLLTRAGFHLFRFDYFGTGDSAGDALASGPDAWRRDVGLAIAEACAISGQSRVSLVGARLGAALATLHAATPSPGKHTLQDLVLWDPIVDGTTYMAELRQLHEQVLAQSRQAIHRGAKADAPEILGWPVTSESAAAYAALDVMRVSQLEAQRVRLITSDAAPSYTKLTEHLKRLQANCKHVVSPDAGGWDKQVTLEQAVLPAMLLRSITEQMTAGAA
jgi:pimeloyl-ACP methyl ester carboxylesterase